MRPLTLPRRAVCLLRRLGPVGPVALAATVLPGVGALVLYGRLGAVAPWLRENPGLGPVLCAATFAAAGGFALVPTYALSALCGWSFGFGVGLAATLSGFLAAALVGYAVGRAVDGGRVAAAAGGTPAWRAVRAALAGGGLGRETLVVALVRLAPAAPFSLTNLGMAAAGVRALPYAVGTACGMAPRTAAIVFAASRLGGADDAIAGGPWTLAGGALATVAVVTALGWLGKRGLARAASVPVGTS